MNFPSSAELIEIQEQLNAIRARMHALDKQFPDESMTFIGIAVKVQDSAWKLDDMIDRAKWVERTRK